MRTDSGKFSVLKIHKHVNALLEMLTQFDNTENNPVQLRQHFLTNLLALQASDKVSASSEIRALCQSIEDQLLWRAKPGEPLSSQDKLRMLATCEEIRLHIVVIALWAARAAGTEEDVTIAAQIAGGETLPLGPIHYGFGGVTHSVVGDKTIILLPPIHEIELCHDVLAELSVLYDKTPASSHWVIDFSAVKQLPDLFYVTLRSYHDQLRARGSELYLCWVPEKLFSESSMEQLRKLFKLNLVGGYYFTETKSE